MSAAPLLGGTFQHLCNEHLRIDIVELAESLEWRMLPLDLQELPHLCLHPIMPEFR